MGKPSIWNGEPYIVWWTSRSKSTLLISTPKLPVSIGPKVKLSRTDSQSGDVKKLSFQAYGRMPTMI